MRRRPGNLVAAVVLLCAMPSLGQSASEVALVGTYYPARFKEFEVKVPNCDALEKKPSHEPTREQAESLERCEKARKYLSDLEYRYEQWLKLQARVELCDTGRADPMCPSMRQTFAALTEQFYKAIPEAERTPSSPQSASGVAEVAATTQPGGAATAEPSSNPGPWKTPQSDPKLFAMAQRVFASELQPDREVALGAGKQVKMTVKRVDRIVAIGNSALVLISNKEDQNDPYTLFRAYRWNLLANRPQALVQAGELWEVKDVRTTSVEPTTVDIFVTALSCTECESVQFLLAFVFDQNSRTWFVRSFGEHNWIDLDSDPQYGSGYFEYRECAYALADLTGDGLTDVAVRCRTTRAPRRLNQTAPATPPASARVTGDETTLYAWEGTRFGQSTVREGDRSFRQIRSALCSNKPRLCASAR